MKKERWSLEEPQASNSMHCKVAGKSELDCLIRKTTIREACWDLKGAGIKIFGLNSRTEFRGVLKHSTAVGLQTSLQSWLFQRVSKNPYWGQLISRSTERTAAAADFLGSSLMFPAAWKVGLLASPYHGCEWGSRGGFGDWQSKVAMCQASQGCFLGGEGNWACIRCGDFFHRAD